jgi:hypothetical protein
MLAEADKYPSTGPGHDEIHTNLSIKTAILKNLSLVVAFCMNSMLWLAFIFFEIMTVE